MLSQWLSWQQEFDQIKGFFLTNVMNDELLSWILHLSLVNTACLDDLNMGNIEL